MTVCCVFSLESPHRGDSNEAILMSTHNIPLSTYKKENHPQLSQIQYLQLWDFCLGTQEQVRNSHGKQPISVRTTEVIIIKII